MNSWPINYVPCSCMFSLELDIWATMEYKLVLRIDINAYCHIASFLNHPVTLLIIVTDLRFKFYFFNLFRIMKMPIRSTHSLFHGISLDSLADNILYFQFDHFVHWKVTQLFTFFLTYFLMPGQYKYWKLFAPVLSITGWMWYIFYQCNTQLFSITRITILYSQVIRLKFILLLLPKKRFCIYVYDIQPLVWGLFVDIGRLVIN